MEAGSHPMQLLFQVTRHLDIHFLIGCLLFWADTSLSSFYKFFTTHTEETQHEDLDVGELVDEEIKDVNTNNMEFNHQSFMASTSELSHDKYGETDYLATSMSLNTSADTIFKYENKANYQIEDRRNVDKF